MPTGTAPFLCVGSYSTTRRGQTVAVDVASHTSTSFSEQVYKDNWHGAFGKFWFNFSDWVLRTMRGINDETLNHPYFISLALIVIWAWPHLLMLPVWFGKDAYHRMDTHAREAVHHARTTVVPQGRQSRREAFISKYRTVFNASYAPPSYAESRRAPLFGGTPLTEGDFRVEEERQVPIALRVVRWVALGWAVYILGRELWMVIWA